MFSHSLNARSDNKPLALSDSPFEETVSKLYNNGPAISNINSTHMRDPRSRKTNLEEVTPMDLPLPNFKIDKNYVGEPLPVEVTICNLTNNVDEVILSKIVKTIGVVREINILYHPVSGNSLGLAKVVFDRTESAYRCVEKLNNTSVMGKILSVFFDKFGKKRKEIYYHIVSSLKYEKKNYTTHSNSYVQNERVKFYSRSDSSNNSYSNQRNLSDVIHTDHSERLHKTFSKDNLEKTESKERSHLLPHSKQYRHSNIKIIQRSECVDLSTQKNISTNFSPKHVSCESDCNNSALSAILSLRHKSSNTIPKLNPVDINEPILNIVQQSQFSCSQPLETSSNCNSSRKYVCNGSDDSFKNCKSVSENKYNNCQKRLDLDTRIEMLLKGEIAGAESFSELLRNFVSDDDFCPSPKIKKQKNSSFFANDECSLESEVKYPNERLKSRETFSPICETQFENNLINSPIKCFEINNANAPVTHNFSTKGSAFVIKEEPSNYDFEDESINPGLRLCDENLSNLSSTVFFEAQDHSQESPHLNDSCHSSLGSAKLSEEEKFNSADSVTHSDKIPCFTAHSDASSNKVLSEHCEKNNVSSCIDMSSPSTETLYDIVNYISSVVCEVLNRVIRELEETLKEDAKKKFIEDVAYRLFENWWRKCERRFIRKKGNSSSFISDKELNGFHHLSFMANKVMVKAGKSNHINTVHKSFKSVQSAADNKIYKDHEIVASSSKNICKKAKINIKPKHKIKSSQDTSESNNNGPVCRTVDVLKTSGAVHREFLTKEMESIFETATPVPENNEVSSEESSNTYLYNLADDDYENVLSTEKVKSSQKKENNHISKLSTSCSENKIKKDDVGKQFADKNYSSGNFISEPYDKLLVCKVKLSACDKILLQSVDNKIIIPDACESEIQSKSLSDNDTKKKKEKSLRKFTRRTPEQELDILNDYFIYGIDIEDTSFLKRSYESMLEGKSEDFSISDKEWIKHTCWVDHSVTNTIEPKKGKFKHSKKHATQCARTKNFHATGLKKLGIHDHVCYRTVQEPSENYDSLVKCGGPNMQSALREARSNQRRLLNVFGVGDLLKFNQLKFRKKQLRLSKSKIHNWGLFALEPIAADEMVIEYVGQVIRSPVADMREKLYEASGIGSSYLFRIDTDTILDATKCGNLARFINHSCNPNCYAKVITIEGEKKIVIYSKQFININEEITYDYKFPIEDKKIPCSCGHAQCRGTLN